MVSLRAERIACSQFQAVVLFAGGWSMSYIFQLQDIETISNEGYFVPLENNRSNTAVVLDRNDARPTKAVESLEGNYAKHQEKWRVCFDET